MSEITIIDSEGNVLGSLGRAGGFCQATLLTDTKGCVQNDADGNPIRFYSSVPEAVVSRDFGIDYSGMPYFEPSGAPWGEVAQLYVVPATGEMFVRLEPGGASVSLQVTNGCIRLNRRSGR